MALLKAKPNEIPPDGIRLSEEDALKYQAKLIANWKNWSDVFAVKYGSGILGAAAALSGIYINNHYRRRYKLLDFGRVSSYLPICFIPAAVAALIHTEVVLPDVILSKVECPVCIEMRAAACQATIGCVFPTVLANVSSIALATKYLTYDVPYLTQQPLQVLKLMQKQTRPIANILFAIFVGQAFLASSITYFESKSVFKVNARLIQLEYELENS